MVRESKLLFDEILSKTNIDCMIIENQIGPFSLANENDTRYDNATFHRNRLPLY